MTVRVLKIVLKIYEDSEAVRDTITKASTEIHNKPLVRDNKSYNLQNKAPFTFYSHISIRGSGGNTSLITLENKRYLYNNHGEYKLVFRYWTVRFIFTDLDAR